MENGSANSGGRSEGRPRIVVVGSGFAGFTCARELERRLGPGDADLVLASPTDYLLYSPLLPGVATGAQDARNIAVPLHGVLKRTRIIPGDTTGVGLDVRTCIVSPPNAPERVLEWDRLVLAPGGVTRSFPIPGLAERARGLKSLGEALYLRDHVLRQLELADASDDPDERRADCTFVVVGAGYVGTEFTAQMQHFTRKVLGSYPSLEPGDLRWMLLDQSPRVLPELGGKDAVAKPLGVEMYGIAAKAVTLAYHLYALSSTPHRLRVGLDWALAAVLPRPLVQLGLIQEEDASLAAERTGIYATPPVPLEEEGPRGEG